MEDNQQITDTQSGMAEMHLQETLPISRQEQDEIERSLTEQQWQQELIRQDMDSDTEITDTRMPLQKDQKQKGNGSDQTEEVTGKGGRQQPPTRITKKPNILRQLRQRRIKTEQKATGNYRT